MKYAAALLQLDTPELTIADLLPGAHVALLGDEQAAFRARSVGLHLRDTLLILSPGPSQEFVFLFRKPVEETVAGQVAATGSGVLHTDACRVAWVGDKPSQEIWNLKGSTGSVGANGYAGQFTAKQKSAYAEGLIPVPEGRWPPNMLLVHSSGCVPGSARVEGHKGYKNGPGGSSAQFSQKGTPTNRTAAWAGHADADGMETVPAWTCAQGCPVPLLTAARFFPQFSNRDEALEWLVRLILPPGALLFR